MTNNLPNRGNSEKNIERIITAARGYDKGHIEEKDIAWILQDYSSNDGDRIKKHPKVLPSDDTNTHEPHQEN